MPTLPQLIPNAIAVAIPGAASQATEPNASPQAELPISENGKQFDNFMNQALASPRPGPTPITPANSTPKNEQGQPASQASQTGQTQGSIPVDKVSTNLAVTHPAQGTPPIACPLKTSDPVDSQANNMNAPAEPGHVPSTPAPTALPTRLTPSETSLKGLPTTQASPTSNKKPQPAHSTSTDTTANSAALTANIPAPAIPDLTGMLPFIQPVPGSLPAGFKTSVPAVQGRIQPAGLSTSSLPPVSLGSKAVPFADASTAETISKEAAVKSLAAPAEAATATASLSNQVATETPATAHSDPTQTATQKISTAQGTPTTTTMATMADSSVQPTKMNPAPMEQSVNSPGNAIQIEAFQASAKAQAQITTSQTVTPGIEKMNGAMASGTFASQPGVETSSGQAPLSNHGTPSALTGTTMFLAEKPTKTADLAGKFLPTTGVQSADKNTSSPSRSEFGMNGQAGWVATSGLSQPVQMETAATSTSITHSGSSAGGIEKTYDMVATNALRLASSGHDSMTIVIKPAADIQISLQLRQDAGGIAAQASLQQGDYHHLSQSWPDLQERLEQRGIQMAPLADQAGGFMAGGGGQPRQSPEGEMASPRQTVTVDVAPAVRGGSQPAATKTGTGWEFWA